MTTTTNSARLTLQHAIPSGRYRFTLGLDQHWQQLCRSRLSATTIRRWATDNDDALSAACGRSGNLNDLVAATQQGVPGANELLLSLVERAQREQLAGEIVIRRLLPGLISAAARYRYLCDDNDPAELAVGALWISVGKYDTRNRPNNVAAALISDTIFAAFRRQLRNASSNEAITSPLGFADLADADRPDPFVEFANTIRDARVAGVPTSDLDLLRQLARTGSPGLVAKQRNVTPRTVRNHRDRAVQLVRTALAA